MRIHKKTIHLMERYTLHVFGTLGIFLFIIFFIRFFVVSPGKVNGPSMEPTFIDDDLFFVFRIPYLIASPERFDLVQIVDPKQQKLVIKRIVGLPGEIVEIKRGKVYIRSSEGKEREIDESLYLSKWVYTALPEQQGVKRYVIGSQEYFVLGDNREHSVDSRIYGPVSRERIVGKIIDMEK